MTSIKWESSEVGRYVPLIFVFWSLAVQSCEGNRKFLDTPSGNGNGNGNGIPWNSAELYTKKSLDKYSCSESIIVYQTCIDAKYDEIPCIQIPRVCIRFRRKEMFSAEVGDHGSTPRPIPLRPRSVPQSPSESQKHQLFAIAGTCGAVLFLVVILLFCCIKRNRSKVGPKNGQRDDKPLLNICSSNVSGSSQKSQSIGYSTSKDFKTASFANNYCGDSHGSSIVLSQPSESTGSALPLPPGRKVPPSAPPPAPPSSPPKPPAPSPPPPPKVVRPSPVPLAKPLPRGPPHQKHKYSSSGGDDNVSDDSENHKAKLKPFFWDKVLANPDDSMVWHELKAGSFQVNEETMKTLFGYTPAEKSRKGSSSFESSPQYIRIIDAKKSQNLAILLKALNVTTEEVCDALKEGNELPMELVNALLKMAPTTEEELKLRLFTGDHSQLGPAEQFLKVMVDIPFAFKRLESLMFMCSLQEEVSHVQESLRILEVASTELRNSRLFLKLLEAVLKTGNRMNDGTFRGGAQAFRLDTLLKLSDVKGTDGKTTLLHFVVQEIIRSEGVRAARSNMKLKDLRENCTQESPDYYRSLGLEVVSELSNDLENVKRAALLDNNSLTTTVLKLHGSLLKHKRFLNNEMNNLEEDSGFKDTLENFLKDAEVQITRLPEEEKRIMAMVKNTADYFHGNSGKEEGLRLFVIVRDFLVMLDNTCKEVKNSSMMPKKATRRETPSEPPSSEFHQNNLFDVRQRLFPAIRDRRVDGSSSDDNCSSP